MGSPQQILGLQVPEHSKSKLLRQKGYEVPLEQRLNRLHHVPDLAWGTAAYELINSLDLLHVGPVIESRKYYEVIVYYYIVIKLLLENYNY